MTNESCESRTKKIVAEICKNHKIDQKGVFTYTTYLEKPVTVTPGYKLDTKPTLEEAVRAMLRLLDEGLGKFARITHGKNRKEIYRHGY